MKFALATTTLAAAFVLSAGISHAQQVQQFGRDSLSVVPGKSTDKTYAASTPSTSGRNTVYAPPNDVSPSDPVLAGGLNRYGRDSVYASQFKGPTTPVASDATGLQPYGRDSVYAIQLDAPHTPDSGTAVGAAEAKGHGG